MEDRMEYRLSDAFMNKEKGDIEVVVLMININYGRNKDFLEKCKPLDEYSWFVSEINKNQKELGDLKRAVDKALDDMSDDYVIKPFLMANRAEVEIMCITEYNEAETMELFREEAREEAREAREEGREEGQILQLISLTQKGLLSEDVAAKEANMSIDEFRKYEARYCS